MSAARPPEGARAAVQRTEAGSTAARPPAGARAAVQRTEAESTAALHGGGPWPPHGMDAWVPHRGAMNLLDTVAYCDEQRIEARVRVPADGVFIDADGVPAWIGIEYMAQAVAAWSGARARAGGGSPRIGYLLGSRRYEATVPAFAVGAELQVFAQCELMGDNGLGMFDCRIELDGRVLASGRLSVFEPPENVEQGVPLGGPGERKE